MGCSRWLDNGALCGKPVAWGRPVTILLDPVLCRYGTYMAKVCSEHRQEYDNAMAAMGIGK
jgi:hypothetical protein